MAARGAGSIRMRSHGARALPSVMPTLPSALRARGLSPVRALRRSRDPPSTSRRGRSTLGQAFDDVETGWPSTGATAPGGRAERPPGRAAERGARARPAARAHRPPGADRPPRRPMSREEHEEVELVGGVYRLVTSRAAAGNAAPRSGRARPGGPPEPGASDHPGAARHLRAPGPRATGRAARGGGALERGHRPAAPAERAHGAALSRAGARSARSPHAEGTGPAPHGRRRRLALRYPLGGEDVWGATARILRIFSAVLREALSQPRGLSRLQRLPRGQIRLGDPAGLAAVAQLVQPREVRLRTPPGAGGRAAARPRTGPRGPGSGRRSAGSPRRRAARARPRWGSGHVLEDRHPAQCSSGRGGGPGGARRGARPG